MSSIFLCHSSKDKAFVRRLAQRLEQGGIRVWLDDAEIKVGESLTEKIGRAIGETDYFGIVLSANSIASHWVQRELRIAYQREIHEGKTVILPVLKEVVDLPEFLRDKKYADFTKKNQTFDTKCETLIRSFGTTENRQVDAVVQIEPATPVGANRADVHHAAAPAYRRFIRRVAGIGASEFSHQPTSRIGLRPPLKWAGGKTWLVPYLLPLWRAHGGRLVEPFCGGLSIALHLMPQHALLTDINPHLIAFYRWLKRGLVISQARFANEAYLYHANRDRYNDLVARGDGQTKEAAELFYYLNRTGYNGLCRFNRSGQFNVPFGRYARINYALDFTPYRHALAGWTFLARDFQATPLRHGDFVFADPPCDVRDKERHEFHWQDQVRAARWLSGHHGPVVLVNHATDRICRLYRDLGFSLTFLNAPQRISCTGDRTPVRAVLALRRF